MQLIADHISHAYGKLSVLHAINFSVAAGELVAIVGPSGCGKSTLLRILGGLELPTSGQALLQGEIPKNSLNPLTYVFQDFALLPWRSVAGNVALALESSTLSAAEQRAIIDDVLKRTGLSDFAASFPKQLSGGMKQRVGIARALAVRPAVLLMDEPLSALDAQTRELLMDDLISLIDGQESLDLASVYVTHNLDEAVRLADRILVLSRRPGAIRETITIDVPRSERRANPALAAITAQIWALIRADASLADRELASIEEINDV